MTPKITYQFQAVAREDKGVIGGIDWNKSPTVEFKTSTGNREGDRVITVVDRGKVLLAARRSTQVYRLPVLL